MKRWVSSSGDPDTTTATFLYYDGWNLLQEGGSGANAQRLYIHGARVDEIVKSFNYETGQSAYHHYDARGHCTMLTDPSGNILEQYDYDAFGFPRFHDAAGNPLTFHDGPSNTERGYSPYGNRFLFTGREWLTDLKLYDYRNRMYQPELGRFLQPDPKQFEAGDYNLYRYCGNDPVNKSDPTGLIPDGPIRPEELPGAISMIASVPVAFGAIAAPVAGEAAGAAVLNAAIRSPMIARGVVLGTAALRVTQHGAERVGGASTRGGALSVAQARIVIQYGSQLTQADGAKVSVVKVAGQYYVAVTSDKKLVTSLGGLSQKAFDKLAKRYGYH